MEKEDIKNSDIYDWEKSSNDISAATSTTSIAAIQYHSTPPENKIPNVNKSDVPTGCSHHQNENENNELVFEQNKLNKVEGELLHFSFIAFPFFLSFFLFPILPSFLSSLLPFSKGLLSFIFDSFIINQICSV